MGGANRPSTIRTGGIDLKAGDCGTTLRIVTYDAERRTTLGLTGCGGDDRSRCSLSPSRAAVRQTKPTGYNW